MRSPQLSCIKRGVRVTQRLVSTAMSGAGQKPPTCSAPGCLLSPGADVGAGLAIAAARRSGSPLASPNADRGLPGPARAASNRGPPLAASEPLELWGVFEHPERRIRRDPQPARAASRRRTQQIKRATPGNTLRRKRGDAERCASGGGARRAPLRGGGGASGKYRLCPDRPGPEMRLMGKTT
jgi:hypothetical protein